MWGEPIVFVSDPDAMKRIFVTHHKNYAKDPWSYKLFGRILGKGLVTSEGTLWRNQRALLSPAFHVAALGRMVPIFTAASQRLMLVTPPPLSLSPSLSHSLTHSRYLSACLPVSLPVCPRTRVLGVLRAARRCPWLNRAQVWRWAARTGAPTRCLWCPLCVTAVL